MPDPQHLAEESACVEKVRAGMRSPNSGGATGTGYIYNNILYGSVDVGVSLSVGGGVQYYVYNNTVYCGGTNYGFISSGSIVAKNNIAQGTRNANTDGR